VSQSLHSLTNEELRARALFFGVATQEDEFSARLPDRGWCLVLLGKPSKRLILRKYPVWFDSEREALLAYLSEMKAHHYPMRLPNSVVG